MGVKQAAVQVLRQAGEALSAQEITNRALAGGLWRTKGKTPAATVASQLYADIKKQGADSPFVQVGPNAFALRNGVQAPDVQPASSKKTSAKYSFTDAAEKVLDEFGSKKPMHYRAITKKALELGLVATSGRTPEATMYAQIIQEDRRRSRRGERKRFERYGKGMVGLAKWHGRGLAYQVEQHNRKVRKQLLASLGKMAPSDFEELIGRLLAAMGFEEVSVTRQSGDGGIDVRGTLVVGDVVRTQMAVQVKRWKHSVGAPIVQQVRGSLGAHEQGLIITTSRFSKSACDEAKRPDAFPVGLMNGEQLVALMVEHGIGIRKSVCNLIEMGEAEDEPS